MLTEKDKDTVHLDCSIGGGQVLRTGIALSTILKTPVEFENIRVNRPKPGLQAQHLTGIKALEQMGAKTSGALIGSQKMMYTPPGENALEHLSLDVGTAGSVTLVLQTLFLPLAFSKTPKTIEISGGTHVNWSPTTGYFSQAFLPMAKKFGIDATLKTTRYGFYPKGGGIVEFTVNPCKELRVNSFLEKGKLKSLEGVSAQSNLMQEIAERQKKSVLKALVSLNERPKIKVENVDSTGQGTFVFLEANYENSVAGFSSLGEMRKPAETIGKEAAEMFLEFHNSPAAIDAHLGDQLIPPMALAKGKSEIRAKITEHLLSNIKVCEHFLPIKFKVEGKEGEIGRIEVNGIGFKTEGF